MESVCDRGCEQASEQTGQVCAVANHNSARQVVMVMVVVVVIMVMVRMVVMLMLTIVMVTVGGVERGSRGG